MATPQRGGARLRAVRSHLGGAALTAQRAAAKSLVGADAVAEIARIRAEDPHAPCFHFIAPDPAFPFDPNGTLYWKGRYHRESQPLPCTALFASLFPPAPLPARLRARLRALGSVPSAPCSSALLGSLLGSVLGSPLGSLPCCFAPFRSSVCSFLIAVATCAVFYIYQDTQLQNGGHCWGHASSTDLLEWQFHPAALITGEGDGDDGIFSGCAIVTKEGVPALVYHGVGAGTCVAFAEDPEDPLLLSWRKHDANPVIAETRAVDGVFNVFDPHCWLDEDGEHYNMILGGRVKPYDIGDTAYLFRSTDLLNWEYSRPFYHPKTNPTPGARSAFPTSLPLSAFLTEFVYQARSSAAAPTRGGSAARRTPGRAPRRTAPAPTSSRSTVGTCCSASRTRAAAGTTSAGS